MITVRHLAYSQGAGRHWSRLHYEGQQPGCGVLAAVREVDVSCELLDPGVEGISNTVVGREEPMSSITRRKAPLSRKFRCPVTRKTPP